MAPPTRCHFPSLWDGWGSHTGEPHNKLLRKAVRHGVSAPLKQPGVHHGSAEPLFQEPRVPEKEVKELDWEMRKLVREGIISEFPRSQARVANVIQTAEKSSGGLRVILDCREVNDICVKPFKVSLPSVMDVEREVEGRNDMLGFTFDLKSMFWSFPLARKMRALMTFQWKGRVFTFNRMPMGWSHSMRYAVEIGREFKRSLQRAWPGARVLMYVDDGLVLVPRGMSYLVAGLQEWIQAWWEERGFTINQEKSCWEIREEVQWLGWLIRLRDGALALTARKVRLAEEALLTLRGLAEGRVVRTAAAARAMGIMMSVELVIPGVKVAIHAVARRLSVRWAETGWNGDAQEACPETWWPVWRRVLSLWTQRCEWTEPHWVRRRPWLERVIWGASDAAKRNGLAGWGFWIRTTLPGSSTEHRDQGKGNDALTIATLEAEALLKMLEQVEWVWSPQPRHGVKLVALFTDNTNVLSWTKGRRCGAGTAAKRVVMDIVATVTRLARTGLRVSLDYIRSQDNKLADALSRAVFV